MNAEERDNKKLVAVISTVRQTLAERLPQLAATSARGLVPLSLALGLMPVIRAPEDVFLYLAGLAPNIISDMLLEMRLGQRQPDVEALAQAIAERLDDPAVQQLGEELQVVTSAVQALQAHGEELKALSQRLGQELERSNWPVARKVQVILANMVAQGENIAQAKDGSVAVVAGPGAVVQIQSARPEVPRKRFLRILIGSVDGLESERQVVKDAIRSLHLEPQMPELDALGSQSASPLQVHQALIQDCDIYVGLLGGGYGDPLVNGKSITHFEIETAREMGKPILLYRKNLPEEEIDLRQKALIAQLGEYTYGYKIHTFYPLDGVPTEGRLGHNLGWDLTGIPPDLYMQVRKTLLRCGPLGSDDELRAVFVDERIRPWRDQLHEANTRAGRVDAVVAFLHERSSASGENGLVLLLQVLRDRMEPSDACYHELDQIASALGVPGQLKHPTTWQADLPALGQQVQKDIMALLSGEFDRMPAPRARIKPTSGRRGLIASLGRSPGAVTGLYYALVQAGAPVDYVRTISTSEFQVKRAVRAVRAELEAQGMSDYEDTPIKGAEIASEQDVMEFKAVFSRLLAQARASGDAVAIGITGGRTVMGALLTMVAHMEAPADSYFYQLSVPDAIEEDGRYPRFHNQPSERKAQVLRPTEFFSDQCYLIEIPFSRFYDDTEAA